jgi:hypothetical protein
MLLDLIHLHLQFLFYYLFSSKGGNGNRKLTRRDNGKLTRPLFKQKYPECLTAANLPGSRQQAN